MDANTAYSSGSNGIVIKTTDGGAHWVLANNGIINTANLTLFFIDANNGYAGGSSGDTAVLYKTINGGLNWTALNTSFLPASFSYISSMYFTSASTGYILANGKVYKTSDGGNTFNMQSTNAAFTYSQITFADANTGYIGGNISGVGTTGGLAKTIDGGLHWTDLTTNINDFNVFVSAIDFVTRDTGYVLASHKRSYIIKTVDGGATWVTVDTSSGFNSLGDYNDLDFISKTSGVAVGTFGRILTTSDGTHFTDISSSISRDFLRSVDFPSVSVGYAIHGGVNIAKTTDQGGTWMLFDSVSQNSLNDIYFTDINTGYAVGFNGSILKTTNGGTIWNPQTSASAANFNSVYFTGTSAGYTGGSGGTLLKTTDGGTNWNPLISGTTDDIQDIYFIDADTGYFISYTYGPNPQGYIWKSKDAGTTWIKTNFSTATSLLSIHFPDFIHGYVAAGAGLIIKTSNGGASWQTLNTGFPGYDVTSLKFTDANTGFATLDHVVYGSSIRTSTGIIIKTTDGGLSWDTLGSKTYPGLTSLTFANSTIGFAVGDESTILKFDLSGNSYGNIQGPGSVCTLGNAPYSVANITGTTYNWSVSGGGTISGSGNAITVNWTSAGSYILSLTPNTTTCGNLTTISYPVTVELLPKPVLTLLSGHQISSDAANGNTWYLDGQLIANATGQTYTATQRGDYTVQVVLNGCTSEFSDPLSVCVCPTGILAKGKGEKFNIYPNPSHGVFTLGFSKEGNREVKVSNALGEQLWSGTLSEAENIIHLPSDLKGIYYMQVLSDEGAVMQKILIE